MYFSERSVYDALPTWLRTWSGDGIISRAASPEVVKDAVKLRIPVVDLNEQFRGHSVPLITNDHVAIGQRAAHHLLERGFTRFGYVGHSGVPWSDRRLKGFAECLQAAEYDCEEYVGKKRAGYRSLRQRSWELELEDLAAWIGLMPKPVGIMAIDDFRGVQFLAACRLAGVAVPEQAAVIGVGNDDVACELATPPLSSVILNAQHMGYRAAHALDCLMRHESVSKDEVLIPPLDVISRQSTDVTAITDPIVAKAMQFIREKACQGINVKDVLQHVVVSRTALQHHFRGSLNQSIHDAIINTRLTRIKELLLHSKLSLEAIADRSGFKHTEYMISVFRQRIGCTPAKFREQFGHAKNITFQAARSQH
jgi:LacI family transcriptional regulator